MGSNYVSRKTSRSTQCWWLALECLGTGSISAPSWQRHRLHFQKTDVGWLTSLGSCRFHITECRPATLKQEEKGKWTTKNKRTTIKSIRREVDSFLLFRYTLNQVKVALVVGPLRARSTFPEHPSLATTLSINDTPGEVIRREASTRFVDQLTTNGLS